MINGQHQCLSRIITRGVKAWIEFEWKTLPSDMFVIEYLGLVKTNLTGGDVNCASSIIFYVSYHRCGMVVLKICLWNHKRSEMKMEWRHVTIDAIYQIKVVIVFVCVFAIRAFCWQIILFCFRVHKSMYVIQYLEIDHWILNNIWCPFAIHYVNIFKSPIYIGFVNIILSKFVTFQKKQKKQKNMYNLIRYESFFILFLNPQCFIPLFGTQHLENKLENVFCYRKNHNSF